MLRVAIIGCGRIADAHASQIRRIKDVEIVGVCDREPLMAHQLSLRFPVKATYTDVAAMLSKCQPDVVHVTTPPESHFELARLCLQSGAHVYIEKPITLFEQQTAQLIRFADEQRLKITAGHDDQFSHAARRMRTLVQQGFLGDRIVHMESYYSYDLGKGGYSAAFLGDDNHWVRRLPGKLLQNVISHGIARICEFLVGDSPKVFAHGSTSPFMKERGETTLIDELRVVIYDVNGATAYFTFSSQLRPRLHVFRLYGTRNGLVLDQDQETVIKLQGERYKSYAEKFVPPLNLAGQYLSNVGTNIAHFWARDFQMKAGMKYLIETFYRSIRESTPLPIPYREILLTSRIMDSIFSQLSPQSPACTNLALENVIHA